MRHMTSRFRAVCVAIALGAFAVMSCAPSEGARDEAWPSYNRSLDGQRHSPLARITPQNVTRLKPVCELSVGEEGGFQTGPVVIGDTMFVTTAHSTVAMNAHTCAVIWRTLDSARVDDPFPVNRGVAYLDGRVYCGAPGGRFVALNSSTGQQLWETKAANGAVGELHPAPLDDAEVSAVATYVMTLQPSRR
jgi:alcohol dehydrogenase (cytochrome c)